MSIMKKQQGFSLLEVMLVLVILVALGTLAISTMRSKMINVRLERTAAQMQQVTQSAVSYFIDNHMWPSNDLSFTNDGISTLAQENYLPQAMLDDNGQFISSWGAPYETRLSDSEGRNFLVSVDVGNESYASVLRGMLPMAYIDGTTVITSVNVPSYNYNNAQSVSHMGIYNLGACVPEPACPTGMKAQITTTPAGIAGVTSVNPVDKSITPIQSFMAYAYGKNSTDRSPAPDPLVCPNQNTGNSTCSGGQTGNYWRACLSGTASGGEIVDFSEQNNHAIQILAMTNCVPKGNSSFTQFNKN